MNNLTIKLKIMHNPFSSEKPVQPKYLQRLFKIKQKENALVELINLLASKPLPEVKAIEIKAISTKYKVDIRHRFLSRLKELYTQYLLHCIADKKISDQEVANLNYLKELLFLNDFEVEEIHNQHAGDIYKDSFNDVISDGLIEESEKEFLLRLQKDMRLTDISEEMISSESTQKYMQIQIDKIIDDGKISPEEWEGFTQISKNLNVDVNWNKKTKAMVDKLKHYWQIEHENLPVQEHVIDLKKNENCYFAAEADWLENGEPKSTKITDKETPAIKIAKGSFYKAGTIDVSSIPVGRLKAVDSGEIIITNMQIHFIGKHKNLPVPLNKIVSVSPFKDGLEIEYEDGKNALFHLPKDADVCAMIVSRAMIDFK